MPIQKLSTTLQPSTFPQSASRTAAMLASARPDRVHAGGIGGINATAARGEDASTRRAGHGGHPWSLNVATRQRLQLQPQDGAMPTASKLTSIAARLSGALAHEPEDARLTGGTRSLTRRLLGLNILAGHRKMPQTADAVKRLPANVQVA